MCGKIWADADRRIIQNCLHGRGVSAPIHLFGSGCAGLGLYASRRVRWSRVKYLLGPSPTVRVEVALATSCAQGHLVKSGTVEYFERLRWEIGQYRRPSV